MFKIAVIGKSLPPFDEFALETAREIGIELAKNKCIVVTGGCRGYPYEASLSAFNCGGKTLAVSPGADAEEHSEKYQFPAHGFSSTEYTGAGIPRRNFDVIENADGVIVIGGSKGTLNEFTLALISGKPIAVLKESKGITDLLPKIAEVCDDQQKENIIYTKMPKQLVVKLIAKIKAGESE